MQLSLVLVVSLTVLAALAALAVETIRQFKRMDSHPDDYTGSDRLAGTAE